MQNITQEELNRRGKISKIMLGCICVIAIFALTVLLIVKFSTKDLTIDQPLKVVYLSKTFDKEHKVNTVEFFIGKDQSNYFKLCIPEKNINSGYAYSATKNTPASTETAVFIRGTWDKQHYIQSSEYDTFLKFKILNYNKKSKELTLELSCKLINNKNLKEYITLKNTEVKTNL